MHILYMHVLKYCTSIKYGYEGVKKSTHAINKIIPPLLLHPTTTIKAKEKRKQKIKTKRKTLFIQIVFAFGNCIFCPFLQYNFVPVCSILVLFVCSAYCKSDQNIFFCLKILNHFLAFCGFLQTAAQKASNFGYKTNMFSTIKASFAACLNFLKIKTQMNIAKFEK